MRKEVEEKIRTIEKLVTAMKRGIGRNIGDEIEKKDKDGYYIPSTQRPQYLPQTVQKERKHVERINSLLDVCKNLNEFATEIDRNGMYLDDLEGPGIDYREIYRLFSIDKETYTPDWFEIPEEYKSRETAAQYIEDMGKGYALKGGKIENIPEIVLDDPIFLLGYVNGHSEEFRLELKWDDEADLNVYYQQLGELAINSFESMRVKEEQQQRNANETRKQTPPSVDVQNI